MIITEITAKNNPKIKEVKSLLTSANDRKSQGLFVLEGARLCYDAVRSGSEIVAVFCTKNAMEKYSDFVSELKAKTDSFYIVTSEIIKAISDTVTPQGVICLVKMQSNTFDFEIGKKYIALDTIQNPDNLGAVSRTAEALGIDGLVIYGGCDVYNPKALRASMGALLRLPIKITKDLCGDIEECKNMGIKTYATVPESAALSITDVDFSAGGMCVIGNEGNGISNEVLECCDEPITIKMTGRAESLNAAAAASIVMWELVK